MTPWLWETAVAALSLAGWLAVYGVMLLVTRPRHVHAGPATQDLGPEPPAVVSVLANVWEVTEDAVESTLLDLGARGYIEFRQPANDPAQTTIHLTPRSDERLGELTPYERSVYDRVSGLAQNGLVPLAALSFRDDDQAASWWKTVRATIIADARARGLSRRRFGPRALGILTLAALLAGVGIAVALYQAMRRGPDASGGDDPFGTAVAAGFFAFLVLGAIGGRNIGERDTPLGREVAARWLGLKQWLRGNDGFMDLPPAAVAVWDRYLGYGAALGTTRVASAVIDMGMGNRRRVWSSFGGTWHRVRVTYPRFWPRYGHPWGKLVFRAVLAGVIGAVLVRFWRRGLANLSSVDFVHATVLDRVVRVLAPVGYALGLVLVVYCAYALVRVLVDALAPIRTTGQVLWVRVWRTRGGGENSPAVPWLYYCAVDDGSGDRTRAWGLPSGLERRCDTGDTVSVTIRRWSRRIVALDIEQRGAAGFTSRAVDLPKPPAAPPAGLLSSLLSKPSVAGSTLLNAEEVGRALGMPVTVRSSGAGPVWVTTFVTEPRGRAVLMLSVMQGGLVEAMWRRGRSRRGAQELSGVGDGAWADGFRGAARCGDTFVGLVLSGPARRNTAVVPELLSQAVSRIPRQPGPVD